MRCWTEIGNNLRPHHCSHLPRYPQNLVPLFNLQVLQFLGQHCQELLVVLVHGLPLLIYPRIPIYFSLASASHAPRAIFSPAPCIFCHWRADLLPDGCRHVCSLFPLFSKLFEFFFLIGSQWDHLAHVMELEISLLACGQLNVGDCLRL